MFLGLMVTFIVSIGFYSTGLVYAVFSIPMMHLFILIAEVGVVMYLSVRLHKLSIGAARGLFFAYAALNGITFTTIFIMYDVGSIIYIFGLTSIYFGALAAYGHFTKTDLSHIGKFLTIGLIMLVVMTILSMFINIEMFDRVLCIIGIAIFLGYTAYDTQKIRHNYEMYSADSSMLAKASIISALQLYLDFINLFLYLLRFLGNRKN